MTNNITLITPPDVVHTKEYSVLLVYPSDIIKDEFNNLSKNLNQSINLYMYDCSQEHYPDWLFNITKQVDTVIVDIDNCPSQVKDIIGYILSYNKTFWLTNGEHMFYNSINRNRIYNLDFLKDTIGGPLEI